MSLKFMQNFQLYSDLFVNNGTYKYTKLMAESGQEVYLYSFNYFNPKSFGLVSLAIPFKGFILFIYSFLFYSNQVISDKHISARFWLTV